MTLDEYLTAEGIAPQDFADRIGVTRECVRLYLAGERIPRRETMEAIREATEGRVRANDFFGEAA